MRLTFLSETVKSQNGAVAVIVGICFFILIGFAALAIDIGHVFVARNELQNAADAGALAGTRFLYNTDGSVNEGANQIAYDAATDNESENDPVEVNWESGTNTGDVQRGHWSFATKTFTPNDSTEPTDLWDVSEDELDDPNSGFINAVKVVTRRESIPITAFFAGIFGYDDFVASTEAIAYIGFAGNLEQHEVDQPIAICSDALRNDDGEYTCSIGRMINSGGNVETSNTGGWTSFNQDDPCSGGTNASELNGLICKDGNPESISLGKDIATIGGQVQSAFKSFYDCWVTHSYNKTRPWEITLPVVECPSNNVGVCERVVGSVTLNIVWINNQSDPNYSNAPEKMEGDSIDDWPTLEDKSEYDFTDGEDRWESFVKHFNLQNLSEDSESGFEDAPYAKKSIYFLPDCEPHEPRGFTGGENFGVLAKIPVLVK